MHDEESRFQREITDQTLLSQPGTLLRRKRSVVLQFETVLPCVFSVTSSFHKEKEKGHVKRGVRKYQIRSGPRPSRPTKTSKIEVIVYTEEVTDRRRHVHRRRRGPRSEPKLKVEDFPSVVRDVPRRRSSWVYVCPKGSLRNPLKSHLTVSTPWRDT